MAHSEECIFCKIARKQIPAHVVYEDENFIAFLDINPANKGHVLVIPKSHTDDFLKMDEGLAKELFSVVQRVANGVRKALNSDAMNIVQNNGTAAGQAIPHVHVHIIPRFENDGLALGVFRQGKYEGNEVNSVRESIKSKIPERKVAKTAEKVEEVKEEKSKKRTSQQIRHIRKEIEIA